MKQKTFELDGELARQFEEFCHRHMLIEKRVAAASLLNFMGLEPEAREKAILAVERFLGGSVHAAPAEGKTAGRRMTG